MSTIKGQAARIQSPLREVACEENSGLKIAIVKIYLTVVSAHDNNSVKNYNEQVVIVVKIGNSGTVRPIKRTRN